MCRPLIVTEFLTLDGVMAAPGGGDHPQAGWTFRGREDAQGSVTAAASWFSDSSRSSCGITGKPTCFSSFWSVTLDQS